MGPVGGEGPGSSRRPEGGMPSRGSQRRKRRHTVRGDSARQRRQRTSERGSHAAGPQAAARQGSSAAEERRGRGAGRGAAGRTAAGGAGGRTPERGHAGARSAAAPRAAAGRGTDRWSTARRAQVRVRRGVCGAGSGRGSAAPPIERVSMTHLSASAAAFQMGGSAGILENRGIRDTFGKNFLMKHCHHRGFYRLRWGGWSSIFLGVSS